MTIEEIKLHRQYAWDYFSLHASQRLDTRNRDLVRHGEDALTAIEAQIVLPEGEGVNALNIMSSEKEATFNIMIEAKKKDVPYIKYLTYSGCFARIFLIFGIIAIALCGMSTIRLIDSL